MQSESLSIMQNNKITVQLFSEIEQKKIKIRHLKGIFSDFTQSFFYKYNSFAASSKERINAFLTKLQINAKWTNVIVASIALEKFKTIFIILFLRT